jgi:hypothetical protein
MFLRNFMLKMLEPFQCCCLYLGQAVQCDSGAPVLRDVAGCSIGGLSESWLLHKATRFQIKSTERVHGFTSKRNAA